MNLKRDFLNRIFKYAYGILEYYHHQSICNIHPLRILQLRFCVYYYNIQIQATIVNYVYMRAYHISYSLHSIPLVLIKRQHFIVNDIYTKLFVHISM